MSKPADTSDAATIFFREKFPSIPRSQIPASIHGMAVTEELLQLYRGHESMLKQRANYSADCLDIYDAHKQCFLKQLEAELCAKVVKAFKPCAEEATRTKAERVRSRAAAEEEARRRSLAAGAQAMIAADTTAQKP